MGARVSAITKVATPDRTASGHVRVSRAASDRPSGAAHVIFMSHVYSIQYSGASGRVSLQDVKRHHRTGGAPLVKATRRRPIDCDEPAGVVTSWVSSAAALGSRERTELPMFGKVEWAESSTRNLACIQLISTHAANTVTGH